MPSATFSALPKLTQASLARVAAAVEGALPHETSAWSIGVSTLPVEAKDCSVLDEVRGWANKSKLCLYYFECTSAEIDLAAVARTFADAKAHEANNRAYARLNSKSKCFYVGSSQSIASRLNEHLGYGAAGTYALQLSHWAKALPVTLDFVCAKYPESTPYSVVQALEDALWEYKNPMFGRQGRK